MTHDNQPSRRSMLRTTALVGGAAAASHWFADWVAAQPKAASRVTLKPGSTVLLQGDSITDAGRNKRATGANDAGAFGRGYAFMIGSYVLASHPFGKMKVYNRGISGHKVPDLDKRWQTDTIDLKPNVVSILIGVNDIWHKLNGRYDGTVESYEKGYADLLARTRKALPDTTIAVCEPFVLRTGAVKDNWFPEFDQRRAAAKRVSDGAGTIWVPFQSMFDEAVKHEKPSYWAGDGVHPSMAGHALMAATWVEHVLGSGV